MSIQTSYPFNYTAGLQGMGYDLTPYEDVTGFASSAIDFGLGLVYDSTVTTTNNRIGVKLPGGSTDVFVGVALLTRKQVTGGTEVSLGTATTTAGAQYDAGDSITIRKRGRLYVYSEQAVSPSDPVFLRYTANGAGTAVGYFRKDADTSRAFQITNAQWVGKITGAGIVVLELNMP